MTYYFLEATLNVYILIFFLQLIYFIQLITKQFYYITIDLNVKLNDK